MGGGNRDSKLIFERRGDLEWRKVAGVLSVWGKVRVNSYRVSRPKLGGEPKC